MFGAHGLRSALIRRISRHDNSHESCFVFFKEMLKKKGVNRVFFVMIHDKKGNTIHHDKTSRIVFFFGSLGIALSRVDNAMTCPRAVYDRHGIHILHIL